MAAPAKPNPSKVFISYARENRPLAKQLQRDLLRTGVEVFIDYENIRGGDSLPARISAALDWCNTLILLWSADSMESYYVSQEWGNAFQMQKRIIPCVFDGSELPPLLRSLLYLDFSSYAEGYAQLCRALGSEGGLIAAKPVLFPWWQRNKAINITLIVVVTVALFIAISILKSIISSANNTEIKIDAAKAALIVTKAAEADRYLTDQFSAAQDSLNAAMAEFEAQNSKFILTRNYLRTQQLLDAAVAAANSAKGAVAVKKEEVKIEAQNLMTSAQAAVEEVKKLFAKAPKGKDGYGALEQMQTELAGAETAIAEADTALTFGDFLGARDKVKAASEKVNSLKQELEDAVNKKMILKK